MGLTYTFAKSHDQDYHKLLIGIFVGAILVNLFAAVWEFTHPGVIEDNTWKFVVFKTVFYITFFLCPYAAVLELIPRKFAWYMFALFALICVIIALYNCYKKIKARLPLPPARNAVVAMTDGTSNLPNISATAPAASQPKAQATSDGVAAAAEDQQNLGSSPNLSCLSATDPAASQELSNLTEVTIAP